MTWQLDRFVTALRELWPDVHETAGWRTRSNRTAWSGAGPVGIMNHHTASNPADPASVAVNRIVNGWSGLPGPIYGVLVLNSGAVHLIAGGPANHAGQGVGRVLDRTRAGLAPLGDANAVYGRNSDTMNGNQHYFSCSGKHRGTHPDWPARQIDAIVAVNAAFCMARGFTPARVVHHREWTARRIDMSWPGDLRARVAARIAGSPPPDYPPVEDDSPMANLHVIRDRSTGVDYAHSPYRFIRIPDAGAYNLFVATGWIDVPHGEAELVNNDLVIWTREQVVASGGRADDVWVG